MEERFNEDVEDGVENQFELGVDFSEASEPEQVKRGLLTRINRLVSRYPKINRLVMSLVLSLELGVLLDQVHKRVEDRIEDVKRAEDSIRMGFPGIQVPKIGNEPSASARLVLEGIFSETGEYTNIRNAVSIESEDERAEVVSLPSVTRVEGFEKFKISGEVITAILEKTLPKGFLRNVRSIRYRDTERKMPLAYGANLATKTSSAAHAIHKTRAIELSPGAQRSSRWWVAHNLLPHEVFHLQDADSNSLLTIDERIDLHRKLIDRVKSPSRFKSSYVEAIRNSDKKVELRMKITEYFAEIGSTYLSPEYYLLPEEDKELIRDFIAKIDPTFDRIKALNIRRDLMGDNVIEVKVKSLEELIKEEVQRVPSIEDFIKSIKQMLSKANTRIPSEEALTPIARRWRAGDLENAISNAKIIHKSLLKQQEDARKVYRGEK